MPRQQRGEDRREQILNEADRLFREQGYTATSMRQIAKESGFGSAVSGLYNHFPNKEAIFKALLEEHSPYEELKTAMAAIDGETVEGFIRQLLAAFWAVMLRRADFLQLVFIDMQEFDGHTLAQFAQRVIPEMFVTIQRLQQFPQVRDDLPLPVITRTIASAMIGYMFTEMMAARITPEAFQLPLALGDAGVNGVVQILVRGICKAGECL